jgi:thiamine pyrophosphate-dependent acetolactate synthase large subunit-like protein
MRYSDHRLLWATIPLPRPPRSLVRAANASAEVVVARPREKGIRRRGWRSKEVASKIAATAENPDPKPYTPTAGILDPRPVIKELDAAIPKDWDIIVAGGHCFSFAMTHLRGRPAGKYHIPIDFGAISSGLSAAIGVAAARNNGKVMLIDGDGSLYLHIQAAPRHCQPKQPCYAGCVGGAAARVGELLCSPIMMPIQAERGRKTALWVR